MKMDLELIIGLGNPEKKYDNTYHNAGFLFINHLEKIGQSDESPYILIKSDVFMNESGQFVAKELKKLGVKPDKLMIAHDDSDIEIGKYKMDFGRGAAGHHGIESIQQHLKTNNFWRLRIGIRPKADLSAGARRAKAEEFVLKKISPENKAILEKIFSKIATELK